MKYCVIPLLLLVSCLSAPAQQDVRLPGIVVEQNSAFRSGKINYLSNAEIKSPGAVPQHSAVDGVFTLLFPDQPFGNVARIYAAKNGYEVVNEEELKKSAVLGRLSPLKIVMCPAGQLYENQIAYYQIARDAVLASYQKKVATLQKAGRERELLLAEMQLEFKQEINSLEQANQLLDEQRQSAEARARELADKFVTVNLDDQSAAYQRAFRAFLTKDIPLALTILDSVDLEQRLAVNAAEKAKEGAMVKQFQESIAEREKQIAQDVNQCVFKARLHILNDEFAQAEQLFELALKYAPDDDDLVLEFVVFLQKQNQFEKAGRIYEQIITKYKALAAKDPDIHLPYVATVLNNFGILLSDKNEKTAARSNFEEALSIRRSLVKQHPDVYLPDLAATLNNLGLLLQTNNEPAAARSHYEEALRIRRSLAKEHPDAYLADIAVTLNNLGNLLSANNERVAARSQYEEALRIRRKLAEKHPDLYLPYVATTLNNLGLLLSDGKEVELARSHFEEALGIHRKLVVKNPDVYLPELATTLNNLGILLRANNDLATARSHYEEALKIRRGLAEKHPDVYLPDVAMTLNNLGVVLRDHQDLAAAQLHYEEALLIRRDLAEKDPDVYLPDVAMTLNNLGNVLNKNQEPAAARVHFEEALGTYRGLAERHPDVYLPNVATSLNNLGVLLRDHQEPAIARSHFEDALDIWKGLAKQHPDVYLPDVSMVLLNLGNSLIDLDEPALAKMHYEEALGIRRTLAEKNPDAYLPDVAMTLNNLAVLSSALNELLSAEKYYEEALEIRKTLAEKNPKAYHLSVCRTAINLALLYKEFLERSGEMQYRAMGIGLMGDCQKRLTIYPMENPTIQQYRQDLDLLLNFFSNFTETNYRIQKRMQVIEELRKENQAETDFHQRVLRQQEIIDTLIHISRDFPEAATLSHEMAGEYGSLAWHLLFDRRFQEAEDAARRGLELDTTKEWINTNLAIALLYQGKFEQASKIYLALKDQPYRNATYAKIFLDDLDALAAEGILHPDVEKVRELLQK